MKRRLALVVAAVSVAVLAAGHLFFALANFGLASEEETRVSVPLVEGIFSLAAAIALGTAALLLFRRSVFRASVVALCGTAPLVILFAFTVPEHSDWFFLFASLVIPGLAGATALASSRRRVY